jgi:hypothetical protein
MMTTETFGATTMTMRSAGVNFERESDRRADREIWLG